MSHINYEYRYQIKPGRFVYVQTKSSAVLGRAIIKQVSKRYKPNRIFYHFQRMGGHVAALRLHQSSAFFSRFDIENFFGQVTRSRIARSLRQIGVPHRRAFNIAVESVVVEGANKVVPFGFCQSPVLATVALEFSLLGSALRRISDAGFLVSVYVDDIIISGDDQNALETVSLELIDAASASKFPLSTSKRTIAASTVEAFNCQIDHHLITVLDDRMDRFASDHRGGTPAAKAAIEKYVNAISPAELARLNALL
ncbi:reverse transcriptase domain-containing protein [Bosea sp. TWI1241]|uniref:reverse transcriptase domain-containing protein n=1 Tax=Bosea sp. TWI1241 TaxID=3148904 RepID=UPI00320B5146